MYDIKILESGCCEFFNILIELLFFLVMCRRPTALQDRMRDSDDDDLHDRDYDVAALANNLSQTLRYKIYGNEDNEEVCSCWLPFTLCSCMCHYLTSPSPKPLFSFWFPRFIFRVDTAT